MAGLRSALGFTSLVLIAAAIVLMFFVVLSGLNNTTPLNKTYFLQADTSSVTGARPVSQWTYFFGCGAGNMNCGPAVPALPFGAPWVGGGSGAPASLVGSHYKGTTSTTFYYLWRFGWVTYLMGLIFTVLAFFTALIAPCSRLASGLSGTILLMALFWFTLGVALMTATFVKARNAFHSAGMSASLGRYAFGFSWGAWVAILLATVLLFLGCGAGGRNDDKVRNSNSGGGMFRRNKSKRSTRGSFVETDSQRRVKDEYA